MGKGSTVAAFRRKHTGVRALIRGAEGARGRSAGLVAVTRGRRVTMLAAVDRRVVRDAKRQLKLYLRAVRRG